MDTPFNLNNLLRDNVRNLIPYSSARDEFKGEAAILIDANENSFGSPLSTNYNRYPDPLQHQIKAKLEKIKGIAAHQIFLGNGSDEAIDLCYRCFCRPGLDNVILVPPTYGMYEVSANINDIGLKKVNLTRAYQLDVEGILEAVDAHTKLIFICSPNNPTGNNINRADIEQIIQSFSGIVIVDEAYIDFSTEKSFLHELERFPNLIVLQTLSKAWGLAALRLGMAFASAEIIAVFNKVKPPYNINQATQDIVSEALDNTAQIAGWIQTTIAQRKHLEEALGQLPFVEAVTASDANFILTKVDDPVKIYTYLVQQGIIVRDRSKVELCAGCLRITVGTEEENVILLDKLKAYQA